MKRTEVITRVTRMQEAPCRGTGDVSLLLQLTSQGEADGRAGRTLPQPEVFARARRRLAQEE